MTSKQILILGGRHLQAVAAGFSRHAMAGFEIQTLDIGDPAAGLFAGEGARKRAVDLAAKLPPGGHLVCLAGNGLFEDEQFLRHAGSFDLAMLSVDGGALQQGLPVIPLSMMRRYLDTMFAKGYGRQLGELAGTYKLRVVCAGPPAPRRGAAGGKLAARDAGALLPLKLWTLQQQTMASFCREAGIVFLGNPREARDEAGFLKRAFHGEAAAGNSDYGHLVAQQIARVVAQGSGRPDAEASGRGAA